jgi:hypothetical protein
MALQIGRSCWQWSLRHVPKGQLPPQVSALPVIAVGADVNASAWFDEVV